MVSLSGFLGRIPESARGGALLVCGVSIFGVADSLTLLVSDTVGVWQFHFSRSALAAVLLCGLAWLTGASVVPKAWRAVGLRTFFLTTSILLFFGVLPMMPIAEAAAGLFTSPIFALLFSRVLFGERIGFGRVLAVLVGSAGVLLILKPGSDGFTAYHALPVLAGAFYALNSITTYRLCRRESALALAMAFFVAIGLAGVLFSAALTAYPVPEGLRAEAPFLFSGVARVGGEFWLVMLVIATAGVVAISLVNKAYQTTRTSYVIVYEYTYLIAAGISGWALWGVVPDRWGLAGILLVVAAGVVINRAQRAALRSVAGHQE